MRPHLGVRKTPMRKSFLPAPIKAEIKLIRYDARSRVVHEGQLGFNFVLSGLQSNRRIAKDARRFAVNEGVDTYTEKLSGRNVSIVFVFDFQLNRTLLLIEHLKAQYFPI